MSYEVREGLVSDMERGTKEGVTYIGRVMRVCVRESEVVRRVRMRERDGGYG